MIKAKPIISGQMYLSDLLNGEHPDDVRTKAIQQISDQVAEIEGACLPDERAWVMVRQATEADNMRRAGRVSKRTVRWSGSDVEEVRNDNLREQWALETYMCLTDAGNLESANGDPLFVFKEAGLGYPSLDMTFSEFLAAYGSLPSDVTSAIRRAVLIVNPDWDYWPTTNSDESEDKEGESGEG